ncbi:MAG: heterodisulfide reductase subunit B [Deltaproteobacteria bacterium]|nr:heterodisulfide reductase subunit B [Deltaproteobacteria bacterium]
MRYSYYPGCSLHSTGKEYGLSVEVVCQALGIELKELFDWSCCGATSAHSTNFKLSVALPARNLVKAEQQGLDVMIPCAACFNRFKSAQYHLAADPDLQKEISETLATPYRGGVAVRSPIDIFHRDFGLENLAARVSRKLEGLKPVSYYGCLWLRPAEVCNFEDPENPVMLDEIVDSLGAESRKWSFKTDCCGGSLTISRTELVENMVGRLMRMAREAGANCIVTACPLCMANLDMRARPEEELPVFYFTELMALAMGLEEAKGWFKLHCIDPRPLLNSLDLL